MRLYKKCLEKIYHFKYKLREDIMWNLPGLKRYQKLIRYLVIFIMGYVIGSLDPSSFFRTRSYKPIQELPYIRQSLVWSHGYYDITGKYKILPYMEMAQNWGHLSQDEGSVCAAVQSSLDRASWLPSFVANWPGPVSFALFAAGPEFPLALQYIQYLVYCFPHVKRQVSFHVVHPTEFPPYPDRSPDVSKRTLNVWCNNHSSSPLKVLQGLRETLADDVLKWRDNLEYPQNILRNVAREHCQTYWVTTPDIDMLFPRPSNDISPSIYERLGTFLTSSYTASCNLCAYVIPIYEIRKHSEHVPKDKNELLQLVHNNQSRQYHVKIFKHNQQLTNHSYWESIRNNGDQVKVIYTLNNFRFYYEPVYIAKRGTPRFDERYIGYGSVRNTQAYELHLAGYTFHVLDNVFLSHWGYREAGEVTETRMNQTARNSNLFCNHYLKELQVKYDEFHHPTGLICWA